jgi:hypothetical protein
MPQKVVLKLPEVVYMPRVPVMCWAGPKAQSPPKPGPFEPSPACWRPKRKSLVLGTGPIDVSMSVDQSNRCGSHALPSTVHAGAVGLSCRLFSLLSRCSLHSPPSSAVSRPPLLPYSPRSLCYRAALCRTVQPSLV